MYKHLIIFTTVLFWTTCTFAQDDLKNLPVYSLPITNKKLVIAHNMTNMITYKGHPLEDSANPKYYSSKDNVSAPLGGLTQVRVITGELMKNATLEEAVAFELKAAIKSGIDGFQFYYVLGSKNWDTIIKAYFKVADAQKLDFKFTFCISHPDGGTEAAKIKEFAERINGIMAAVGKNNKHWLRTPDGRLLVYLWNGDGLADMPTEKRELPKPYYIARAYQKLATAVNEKFACIFTINEQISEKELNQYLDYFPATWIWTLAYNKNYIGEMVANTCIKRNRTFTGSVFGDFYTSKLLKKGTWEMYHNVEDAVKAGLNNVERRYLVTGLSYNFRKLMEFNLRKDVPIINVITWNDYPEGHHIAPEVNHNYGFSILLNYYKSLWLHQQPTTANKDVAIVFFKKYKHRIKPVPYGIPVFNFQEGAVAQKVEDSIEVVTILPSAGMLIVNNDTIAVKSGFSAIRFPSKNGPVKVEIWRNKNKSLSITSAAWITEKPYRTDLLTYIFSSEDAAYQQELFSAFPLIHIPAYSDPKP